VPLAEGHCYLLARPFAAERLDVWVLRVSIAIVVVAIAVLGLWHLVAYLIGKLQKKRRAVRQSPEPPSASRASNNVLARDDPERLQQSCATLEDSLADNYMELAEIWLHRGQPQKAAAEWKKILLMCPEKLQAEIARDRLQQLGIETPDSGLGCGP
jgi:hypothetical protein